MSLTEISYYFRKSLPFIILGFLIVLVFVYFFRVIFLLVDTTPQQEITVNTAFGKLPEPIIPQASSSAGLSYFLDTVEGTPTTATPTAQVFFLPQATTKFGYREKIYLIAKNLGFNTEVTKHTLVGTEAVFDNGKERLAIDITNFNYNYEYRYATDEAFFKMVKIPDEDTIVQEATDFLNLVGRYPEELAQGKSHILYFNLDVVKNRLYGTETRRDANVVEVDYYRPDVVADPYPIPVVPPTYFNSQNHVVMVFHEEGMKVLRAQISFYEKSETQIGVYPLKTGDTAWEELTQGKGMVVVNETSGGTVNIKRMFLGYYDPAVYQPYLEPVYVFLGDNNFVAYVPAVSNEYLTK